MTKKSYTLLEYLVALENKLEELKKYVDEYDGIQLGNIENQINNLYEFKTSITNTVESNNTNLLLQLEQKADENEVRKKNDELTLNDFDEASRSAITGGDYNLNYVLGERNVKSKNIDFLNVNLNHLSENCFNEGELPSISKKVIGFDISQKSQEGWLNGTAMGCYFKFPMTMFSKGEIVRFEYELEDTNNCFSNVGHWILYGNETGIVEIETRVSAPKVTKYSAEFNIKDTTQSHIYVNVFLTNVAKDWYNYSIKNAKITRLTSKEVIECNTIGGFLNSKDSDEITYTNIESAVEEPDFSKLKLVTNKTLEKIITKPNKVVLNGTDITIQFPFNDSYELKVMIGQTCANNVMNFKKIYKVDTKTGVETLTDSYGTDWLAPIIVGSINNADGDRPYGSGYYCSGNHDFNNGDTGSSKNARCENIKFYIDGKRQTQYNGNCENVKITWDTYIQGYNTQKADGTGREIIKEHYIIEFHDGKFNVENEINALEDIIIKDYYGLQCSCPSIFADKVHFEIDNHLGMFPITDSNPHKKNISTVTCIKGDDRLEMYLDRNYGLGKYGSNAHDYDCFTTVWNKIYFVLVKGKDLTITQGNKVGWRGYYRFYSV